MSADYIAEIAALIKLGVDPNIAAQTVSTERTRNNTTTTDNNLLSNKSNDEDGELQSVQSFCSRLQSNDRDIPDEGTGLLQIQRAGLVDNIIKTAQGKKQQVLLRGAAGTGKTSLLAYVGQKLENQGHRVLIASNPSMLPKLEKIISMAWNGFEKEKPADLRLKPLYLLVDEAQQSYSKGVLHALVKIPASNRNVVIIAAGIPGKAGESAAFTERIESDKVLLTSEEVQQANVMEFFSKKLVDALENNDIEATTVNLATLRVLMFSHYYSAGHAYACLKIAEYLVTKHSNKCIGGTGGNEELGLLIGSKFFLEAVGWSIFRRCFPFIAGSSAVESVRDKYINGSVGLVTELNAQGLWDTPNNCLLSPLLKFHLFNLVPKIDDFIFSEPSQIGEAIYFGRLNMYLELVKNGSLLEEHFDRFISGDYGLEKPFAVLDINFNKNTTLTKLKGKYAQYEKNFYQYFVHTRELYCGMELFKSVTTVNTKTPHIRKTRQRSDSVPAVVVDGSANESKEAVSSSSSSNKKRKVPNNSPATTRKMTDFLTTEKL